MDEPFGIGERHPRFSWWLPEGVTAQTGYRIQADNGWDSRYQVDPSSLLRPYSGPPLRSRETLTWRVMAFTEEGESGWSTPASLEMGLLDGGDWRARWVRPVEPERAPAGQRGAYLLRTEFTVGGDVSQGRLYASAQGIYELFLNGKRVGDHELTPGYTEYRRRLQVHACDVSAFVEPGSNVLGAVLSDGWFRGQVGITRAHDQWGDRVALLAQLEVLHSDGSIEMVATNGTWRSRPSHIVAADLIAGQTTDFRRYPNGWDQPGFDAADWTVVDEEQLDPSLLVHPVAPPVRAIETRRPLSVRRVGDSHIFDLGQNVNGWVRLRLLGPPGTDISLTHGEALAASGDLTTENLEIRLPFLPEPWRPDRSTS